MIRYTCVMNKTTGVRIQAVLAIVCHPNLRSFLFWLVVWNHGILWLSIQLGMSPSQLTHKQYFSERWRKTTNQSCLGRACRGCRGLLHVRFGDLKHCSKLDMNPTFLRQCPNRRLSHARFCKVFCDSPPLVVRPAMTCSCWSSPHLVCWWIRHFRRLKFDELTMFDGENPWIFAEFSW